MAIKIGFFEESEGQKSFMRLSSFILLAFFILINSTVLGIHIKCLISGCMTQPQINDNFLWFDAILLCFVFCPKVAQKLIESKFNVSSDDVPKQQN
jgi:hypothetical protein